MYFMSSMTDLKSEKYITFIVVGFQLFPGVLKSYFYFTYMHKAWMIGLLLPSQATHYVEL